MSARCSRLAAFAATLLASAGAFAQAPSLVPVQGFLADNVGTPIDGTLVVGFRLYSAATGGALLYSEAPTITVTDGNFTALLGETVALDLALFRDETVYLGVIVGGIELSPRLPIGTAPYAGYARWAEAAATAMSVDWSDISNVPAGLADGDDVGSTYSASLPINVTGSTISLVSNVCAAGGIWTWTGTTWTCAVPVTTSYTAGDGLSLASGQFAVNSSIQRRVSASCDPNEYIYQINPDGTVLCETDDVGSDGDITAVTTAPTSGLTGGATSGAVALAVDKAQIQARIEGTCGAGRAMQSINQDGTVNCVDLVPSSAVLPPGVVMPYTGVSVPSGWLDANGAAVSRTTYAELFAVVGTTYGAGDGSSTFNLPDMRGRTPVGSGQGVGLTNRTLGTAFGAEAVTFSQGNLPNVTLNATTSTGGGHLHSVDPPNTTSTGHQHGGSTAGAGGHNHGFDTAWHDTDSANSQGYPAGNGHFAFRTTDRRQIGQNNNVIHGVGDHGHNFATDFRSVDVNIGAFNSASAGDHNHTVSVPLGGSGTAVGIVQPSIGLRYLIKH